MVTAEARVATARASAYVRKLCRHIERIAQAHSEDQLQVEWSESHGTASFGWGRCTLQATPEDLILRAEAADPESLRRLEGLIATRLETLGSDESLMVAWIRTRTPEMSVE